MILSPELYGLLTTRFSPVRVSREGEQAIFRPKLDFRYRPTREIVSGGEEYIVACPFCGDRTGHLYINHRYGSWDPNEKSDNFHLAHCFRRDCLKDRNNRQRLADYIFGVMPGDRRAIAPKAEVVHGGRPIATTGLVPIKPPGCIRSLTALEPGHKARAYLTGRGFDLVDLETRWNVGYCADGDWLAADRIYVPFHRSGVLVGWIARWPDDDMPAGIKKYQSPKGLRKSQLLYNYDLARQQPFVVICEGVTDVWRVGPPGVALIGKNASTEQVRLLAVGWRGKPAVVLLDADAAKESEDLYRQLQPYFRNRLVQILLPEGLDPAACARADLRQLIFQQAAAQGVALPATIASAIDARSDAGRFG